ncbi:putative ubiquitin ligase E3 [Schistosoma mansoni]|uniref:putative ubiquitin ligase E3 n=1 Tax=Schistosoma mansoni TaxID=6183 RepID=UPI00022DC222|nr:putative ubiquitin ligase E3 [Schistosoma mansoni]|eukprot:XP_018651333.1 putative ubiquitin ligase E3 [Schistosoma mansoni]
MSSLWPPFHKPKQLPPDFRGLDHVLHSRHLHYIIFIQLSLFVYGDPLVTEESLAMIIHLIDRALDTPCRLPGNNRKTCTKIFMESQASKSSESNLPTSSLNNVNNYETGTKNLIEQKQTEEMDEIQQQQPLKPKDLIAEKSQNAFVDDFIMDWEKGVGSSDDRDLNELTIDSQRINNKQLRTKTRNYRSSHIWRRQPWSSLCPLPSTPSFSSSSNTTTATNPSPTNNRQKKFWDTSLINCPYQSRTSIQDNLNCWLMISNHNIPQVSCAQVMLASLPMNQGSDLNCTLSTVPVLSNNEIQNDSKNIMLDSIISLLIKAHARLYWSRIVGGADAIPKISFGGSLFTDPNLTAQQSGITDSSMSVTTTMPAVNVDGNNPIILGQDQVDGSWQDFLDVFPKHNTVVSNATTTTNNNCLTPRCMAVLMPNERHECSNLNNSSSPTASSSFASNNVNLNTSIIASLPPELRYFASSKPTYFLPEERNESTYRQESINAKKSYNFTSSLANNDDNSLTTTNDVCHFTNFGDGAYWIERLLDKIASLSENNKSAIKMYLARARSPYKQVIHLHTLQPMDVISSSSSSSNVVQQCQQKQQLTVSHNSNTMNSSKEVIGLNNETDVIFNIPFSSTNDGNNSSMNQNSSCLLTTSAVGTRDERKRAAQERRKRLIEQMTSKQKAFASTHLKDIESLNRQTVDRKEQLDNSEPLYECVICQISGRPSVDDMVLLDMICESNLMLQLRETAVIPTLYGRDLSHSSGYPPVLSETDDLSWLSPERPPVSGPLFQNSPLSNSTNSDNPSPVSGSSQAPAGIVGLPIHPITTNSSIKSHTERSSSPKPETLSGNKQSKHHSCYTEHRQWWSNAIPSLISKTLPLLHSGILLQTCGHVVHRECFQRYRTHGGNRSAATRHRSWIVCPLCRRDIHHLLPLVPLPKSGTFGNKQQLFPSVEYGQQNIAMLLSRLNSLSDTGSTFWNDLNCSEDELNVQRRILMSQLIGSNYEATILLRFPVFALLQDPADILLGLLPHIWPHEGIFHTVLASTFCLAYIRALISVTFNRSTSSTCFNLVKQINRTKYLLGKQQLIEFSDLCRILSLDCGDSTVINVAQVGELAGRLCGLCSPNNNNAIECLIGRWIGQIKKVSSVHLTASSPTLLLSSSSPVCDVSSHINDNNNDVNQLSNIDHRNILTEVENVSSVSRGTPYFILHIAEYLRSLVEIGRQLCSPRLIRTPSSFDVLFNALHLVNCSSNQHRFQDNILCLICGRLLCSLCSNLATVVVEHTYMCGGFSGVVLEVNTSIVYVSLGSNICDWGSVYLDEYGEEDLELKRGKPLFLNAERFALLENQWITHSFRHVLKNWRSV